MHSSNWVLCNTVPGSNLEEPYILIHVFMMCSEITVSRFYTSLGIYLTTEEFLLP